MATNHNKIGGVVVFMDELRQPHLALVTNDFNKENVGPINVAYVNQDPEMVDPYGQQLKRATSVAFWGDGGYADLLANCWMYIGDYKNLVAGVHGAERKNRINGRLPEETLGFV